MGQNAFNHGSGIHVHGTLAHSLSYEPIPPELVGRKRSFYLGKFAGRHLIEFILRQNHIQVTKEQVRAVADAVKEYHAQKDKREILKRFDQCKVDFSQLKADLSVEEVIDLAKDIIEGKK